MDDQTDVQTPSQVLGILAKLANDQPSTLQQQTQYDTFLWIEKTPTNLLFFKASIFFFLLQFILFYATWAVFPIFGKERRRLSWTLSFYCTLGFMTPSLLEWGYIRLTIYERLGLDAVSLGLEDPEGASVFSVWLPQFLSWVQQLPAYPFSVTEVPQLTWPMVLNTLSSTDRILRLCATALQWMVSLPIFSLAPLKPTQLFNPNALSPFLGGGSRLLYSLENHPHESVFGAIAVGYFVGYSIADMVLGFIHYQDEVNPLSGWIHHVVYTLLAWRLAIANHLSIYAICGGPLELSSIFLATGNMFPHLKSAFWFPVTFILCRIIGHILILQEILFNYPTPSGAAELFAAAWILHIFWINQYFAGVRRRARRAKKAAAAATLEQDGGKEPLNDTSVTTAATSTSVSTTGFTRKAIQLRMRNSK